MERAQRPARSCCCRCGWRRHFDTDTDPKVWIRVYPDDLHVDAHEPGLTAAERAAGERYWASVVLAADATPKSRAARDLAWRALLDQLGLARAAWTREVLAPGHAVVPDAGERAKPWTRPAHTTLLPHHFVFSAYKGGRAHVAR